MTPLKSVVHSDPDILGGVAVFVGTRVPVHALIDYLGGGQSLAEFLEDFPSVSRDQAMAVLKVHQQFLDANTIQPQDEWERGLLAVARDCGVSLSDSTLSSEGLYE